MYNILLLLSIFSYSCHPEPQFGYWICDAIKQEKNVDFVLLPENAFSSSSETLIILPVSNTELNQLISKNLSLPRLIPISGFIVVYDSFGRTNTFPNLQKQNRYDLITTKSLPGLSGVENCHETSQLNQTITEIVISYLNNKPIMMPEINRYQFALQSKNFEESVTSYSTLEKFTNKVNINTATIEELMLLPGIGQKLAQKIIDHRKQNGQFNSIQEIIKVKGIGPKKFEDIKNLITI